MAVLVTAVQARSTEVLDEVFATAVRPVRVDGVVTALTPAPAVTRLESATAFVVRTPST